MSQAVRRPVRVQFMRWDELGCDNYVPPHLADVCGGVDVAGNIVGSNMTLASRMEHG
jgi:hypothetical protein